MDALAWLAFAAVVGANVHALIALALGFRAREAEPVLRQAKRCAGSAGIVLAISAIALAVSLLGNDRHIGDSAVDKAARLAMTISEVLNTVTFAVIGVLIPLAAAGVLRLRGRKMREGEGR